MVETGHLTAPPRWFLERLTLAPATADGPRPAMYPTERSLKDKERDMGAIAWAREMLLKIVAEDDAVIALEDIHY